jgi:hypothetical protein
MAIKKSITDTYSKPKPKPTKKPYVTSTKEPELQGGRTARIKADYKKAVKGGAAKAAKKLLPRDVTQTLEAGVGFTRNKDIKSVSPQQQEKRKAMAQRIINDKSKNVTRAKIAEMNAKKARTKKAK